MRHKYTFRTRFTPQLRVCKKSHIGWIVARHRRYSPSWLSMDSFVHPCTSVAMYRSDFKYTLSHSVDTFGMCMYAGFLRLWISLNVI